MRAKSYDANIWTGRGLCHSSQAPCGDTHPHRWLEPLPLGPPPGTGAHSSLGSSMCQQGLQMKLCPAQLIAIDPYSTVWGHTTLSCSSRQADDTVQLL